ncbi:hypothetical protein D7006_14185 [Xanthobacter sp. YC-JY1]|nr:hypothetical protein D7006_14185 [Xanthobacter sp. YC-JY1]
MSAVPLLEFLSSDIPDGSDTVWGWLARHEPEALYFMESPGLDALEFEEEAKALAAAEGIYPMTCPSPEAVRATGGPARAFVFPNLLLRAVFARR